MVEKLLETYEKIYDKKFEISDMDSKKEMQKANSLNIFLNLFIKSSSLSLKSHLILTSVEQ